MKHLLVDFYQDYSYNAPGVKTKINDMVHVTFDKYGHGVCLAHVIYILCIIILFDEKLCLSQIKFIHSFINYPLSHNNGHILRWYEWNILVFCKQTPF